MSTKGFLVRWIPAGEARVLEQERHAESADALRSEIEAGGGRVLQVSRYSPGAGAPRRRTSHPSLNVSWWCRELMTLVRAGMTAVEAIETLQLQSQGTAHAAVHNQLATSLKAGKSLSVAMASTHAFPKVLVASVTASERTSTLVSALEDYLGYDAQMQSLRRKAVGAAIYPLVVIGFGGLVALFLLTFVVPRFAKVYGSFHGSVSTATQVMLWLSAAIGENLPEILLSVAGLIAISAATLRLGWFRPIWGLLAEALPVVRVAVRHFRSSQLYQSLALTLRGGYPLVEAIQVCESLALGGPVTASLVTARQGIMRGQAASQAFAEAGLTDAVAQRLLQVGERTGQFSEVLQALADRESSEFATFVERSTRLIEPILLLVVAAMVGAIVVMMYMPIFDIANTLQ